MILEDTYMWVYINFYDRIENNMFGRGKKGKRKLLEVIKKVSKPKIELNNSSGEQSLKTAVPSPPVTESITIEEWSK